MRGSREQTGETMSTLSSLLSAYRKTVQQGQNDIPTSFEVTIGDQQQRAQNDRMLSWKQIQDRTAKAYDQMPIDTAFAELTKWLKQKEKFTTQATSIVASKASSKAG